MNIRIRTLSAMIILAASAAAQAAAPRSLPLEGGTYVMADPGTACEAVANAGTVYLVDGNLSFPHDHQVHSKVVAVSPAHDEFTVRSTLTAYDAGGKANHTTRTDVLKVADKTHFTLLDGARKTPGASFHRCGPAPKLV